MQKDKEGIWLLEHKHIISCCKKSSNLQVLNINHYIFLSSAATLPVIMLRVY